MIVVMVVDVGFCRGVYLNRQHDLLWSSRERAVARTMRDTGAVECQLECQLLLHSGGCCPGNAAGNTAGDAALEMVHRAMASGLARSHLIPAHTYLLGWLLAYPPYSPPPSFQLHLLHPSPLPLYLTIFTHHGPCQSVARPNSSLRSFGRRPGQSNLSRRKGPYAWESLEV